MKKRILASALALCMALSVSVTASATDTTVPRMTNMTLSHTTETVASAAINGSFLFTAPISTDVADYTVSVTLSEGSAFTASTPTESNTGELYVSEVNGSEVTLKFNMTVGTVDLNSDQYALTLTSVGGSTWTGGFENAGGLSLETMAGYLAGMDISLAGGALGAASAPQDILVNYDDDKVVLAVCDPDAVVYTVNYVVDEETTLTWKLPAGAVIPPLTLVLSGGKTIEGWFLDPDCNTALTSSTTVTGNTTVYAKVNVPAEDKTFLEKLEGHENVTITTKGEWDTFVEHSDVVVAGQLITLGADIDCQNTTYDSMTFRGNFNGNGKTISNATFRAVDSAYYNSTESDIVCSGMFAALGAGQIVANLTLENIQAQYASTYSAVLAGLADGTSANPVLIQNVQVRNSSASGRTAAGVVGFTRNVDVKFCSSRDTTITGLANGGGVVGINNAIVSYCYSTTLPTALPALFGGSTGGVVSKNVRGGYTDMCWSTMTVVGASDVGGTDIGALVIIPEETDESTFENAGFNADGEEYWVLGEEDTTDFLSPAVTYTFPSNI